MISCKHTYFLRCFCDLYSCCRANNQNIVALLLTPHFNQSKWQINKHSTKIGFNASKHMEILLIQKDIRIVVNAFNKCYLCIFSAQVYRFTKMYGEKKTSIKYKRNNLISIDLQKYGKRYEFSPRHSK